MGGCQGRGRGSRGQGRGRGSRGGDGRGRRRRVPAVWAKALAIEIVDQSTGIFRFNPLLLTILAAATLVALQNMGGVGVFKPAGKQRVIV